MLENLTDDALVQRYVQNNDLHAFDVLTLRHRDPVYWHFYKSCPHDAEDLVQELLQKLLGNLYQYKPEGKFPAYLSTLAKNMLIDHWRTKQQKIVAITSSESDDKAPLVITDQQPPDKTLDINQRLQYIFHTLIPQLPCKERIVYLLVQESNFWDGMQKLSWHDLAALNGIAPNEAALRFQNTRDSLLQKKTVKCEDLLIFLIWTQSQRIDKKQKFTMSYFADLLNINTNTFKTREREAKKKLKFWINRWEMNET